MTSSSILYPPGTPPAPIVDFGWYYGLTPSRLPEVVVPGGWNAVPLHTPGVTTLSSNFTLVNSGTFTLPVAATSSFFVTADILIKDYIVINNGTQHDTITYQNATATTFTGCTATTTHTYSAGTPVYDPRWYTDSLPLQQPITFDAKDAQNLGLPTTIASQAAPIINYQWSFGNGETGYGSSASTEYTYTQAVPSIQATLTVTDAYNRRYSTAHILNIQNLRGIYAHEIHTSQGSNRPH